MAMILALWTGKVLLIAILVAANNQELYVATFALCVYIEYSLALFKDVYESAQKIGKYKTIPRTEGVSTTEIVGRMLLMQKSHLNLTKKESEYVVYGK